MKWVQTTLSNSSISNTHKGICNLGCIFKLDKILNVIAH